MRPLSDIVIHFHQRYNHGRYVDRRVLRMFSEMDLEMLVDMGILRSRSNPYFDTKLYRLRLPRKSTGTKMVYSQRAQYSRDYYHRRKAA